jgi:cyclopropane-fatty-acyl-phospholipid synthase
MNWYEPILERDLLPDGLIRNAVRHLIAGRLAEESAGDNEVTDRRQAAFVEQLRESPVAIHTVDANRQHYEVPARFFELTLGPHLKYSSCYWAKGDESLAEAELAMLELTVSRARIAEGQRILELGCGWGSLSLFMAAKYPAARITGVSNSASQREFILNRAKERGLTNLEIITCDMNDFEAGDRFDRVVSIEMFEHMRNYEILLRRISTWLKPGGLLFVHIFAHRRYAYPFEVRSAGDWMAEHFFTGGIMPSVGLLEHFHKHLCVTQQWVVNGQHYQRTSEEWLRLTDSHRTEILQLFAAVYGKGEALKWLVRWRVFYIACAELFGFNGGNEWVVAHYLFAKRTELR